MRIQPYINNINTFTSLLHTDSTTGVPCDGHFYRDYETIKTSIDDVQKTFPNGADILDYACSNGEETISIKSLLSNSKYKVIGYDISLDPLILAKKGVYSVFSHWHDSFLLPDYNPELSDYTPEQQKFLREKFNNFMVNVPAKKDFSYINNRYAFYSLMYNFQDFRISYYSVKDEFKNSIDIRYGDINNVHNYHKNNNPVGAIFFRNAIYQLCENDLTEVISQLQRPNTNINRKEIIKNLIAKINHTLDVGGLLVIGNHIKEHLFLADDNTKRENLIFFGETPYFSEKSAKHRNSYYMRCCKKSPLIEAIEECGCFVPVKFSYSKEKPGMPAVKVPVIFKKIRV